MQQPQQAFDALVVGAGMVGAACALTLQREGLRVGLLDARAPGSGITAVGMGHLVALDESDDELDLCLLSLGLWRDYHASYPEVGDYQRCGTLWVAENEDQLLEAHHRAERLSRRGWDAAPVRAADLHRLEPALRRGLCGGVRVAMDAVVYPPAVAHHLATMVGAQGGRLLLGRRVMALAPDGVVLDDGARVQAQKVVIAAGAEVAQLLPEVPVFGRKGHLAVTDRYPGLLSHQIVSMNYGQSAGGMDALAVAANVQPRATGQWLVGSCRQDNQSDNEIDPNALSAVLATAIDLLPCLGEMRILRAWAGMRPASPDGNPLIGVHPGRQNVWLAVGHEGLGVTTAFGTARLLADQMLGRPGAIDATAFSPYRFESLWRNPHAA